MRLTTLTGEDLRRVCVRTDQSVRESMAVMSDAGLRLAPVLDAESGRFYGVAADGDLRRFLAANGSLEAPVSDAANRNPVVLEEVLNPTEVRSRMLWRGIEYLPLLRGDRLEALYVLWTVSAPERLTAVIMAGGLGSRLKPLTDACPKPLIKLGGKPILTHIIEHLRNEGVGRFVLSINYLGDMIVDHYGDGASLGVEIAYVHETSRMGTGGALGLIDPATLSEPFVCLNGDILNDLDLNALRERHLSSGWDATMVVRDHNYTVPYGVVRKTDDGSFVGSEEKPTMVFQINAGIYMLSKSVLPVVPKGRFYDLPTLFEDMRTRDLRSGTFTHQGRWIDVGTREEYERALDIFEAGY
ncbi:UTP--glucose-1-phosphate uridylyltransferase [Defluviimonas aquaemixtae]|uniref:UTP--glucose-1-phosphate uridylyltransferase n=1 Tax=Albidovulum aquaemixtae TaxID=1542388 RepID=A0A2R8B2L6_9RHOB|nr:nucleotidyltransferase family protein [Defluviimonas aquaemixtae]SPH16879.1 UTP--glucose-1-phosphate uridylyltransferase [Defluviimonas aquaemixtae]